MSREHYGWIGVDLDGTLAHYDGFKGPEYIGEPIPTMVSRVKAWRSAGQEVRIFTARACSMGREDGQQSKCIAAIKAWCLKHIGEELPVTHKKDWSMIVLYDDRCRQVVCNTGELVGEAHDVIEVSHAT